MNQDLLSYGKVFVEDVCPLCHGEGKRKVGEDVRPEPCWYCDESGTVFWTAVEKFVAVQP